VSYLDRFKAKRGVSAVSAGTYPLTHTKIESCHPVHQYNDRLIDSVDALNNHIRTCTDSHPEEFAYTGGNPPAETTKTLSAVFAGSKWPPRPVELAHWPDEWREQWGRLANALEDNGIPFPDSEAQAFAAIKQEMAAS
jgi:hypothetical protein